MSRSTHEVDHQWPGWRCLIALLDLQVVSEARCLYGFLVRDARGWAANDARQRHNRLNKLLAAVAVCPLQQ